MQLTHGPYRVLAGKHTEDVPKREATVTKIDGINVELSDGTHLTMDNAGKLNEHGQRYHCYLGSRRVASFDLHVGDEVTLCQPVTYRTKKNEQTKQYDPSDPFMSSQPLDRLFNQTGENALKGSSTKFLAVNDNDKKVLDENEKLRARIAELEASLVTTASATATLPSPLAHDLQRMSVAQLREFAASEEIDIPAEARTKEAIIAAINAAT